LTFIRTSPCDQATDGIVGAAMREEDLRWPYIYTVTWQGLTIPPPEIQSQTKTTVRKC